MRRSTCSNPRPHTSSPVSTWSFAPRTHKHWVTSLPSHFPPPGSPSLPLPKFCPIAHWNQGHVSPTESGGMYLWTSLFHEALFEVLPGDEGHELGEERHNTDPPPRLTRQGFKAPRCTWLPSKGEVWNGEGCVLMVHRVIFGMWYWMQHSHFNRVRRQHLGCLQSLPAEPNCGLRT